ncbi:MAG: DUF3078 domain-containing protein [Ignavibacteria bacterium]|nr:DUF3078 domain-containing protein [Ignavibacteria bacterium]
MNYFTALSIFIIIFLFSGFCTAQEIDTTLKYGWSTAGTVGANFSQITFENWVQGGESSFSLSGIGNFGAYYRDKNWFLLNRMKLAYGRTKSSSRYFTTDNELRLENLLIKNIGWTVNPYFSNELRTGLANGFDYSGSVEQQITAFFDPGYISQSIGFIYMKKIFLYRLGVGLQETFTNKFNIYSDDPETLDKIEKFKIETGIESVAELNYEFLKNMIYASRLRLFSRFNSLDVWDANWDNIITAKINDYFNVNFQLNVIYQKDQSLKTQMKEALQLGFSYVLF